MIIKKSLLLAVALALFSFSALAAEGGSAAGMRVYSGLTQAGGGDYIGFQVTLIPYAKGVKVLWRDQEGGPLQPPLMLDATPAGGGLKVTVPGAGHSTDWVLIQQNGMLWVQDPWGLHFELKELVMK